MGTKKSQFERTASEQIKTLILQSNTGKWRVDHETVERLQSTAPEWPEGRDAFRSFRIRFGNGDEGVIETCMAHTEAIRRTNNGANLMAWESVLSDRVIGRKGDYRRLRLLGGNGQHHAEIEWIIIHDLSAHRFREDVSAVRGEGSLADEGLVLAWMFPDRIRTIDYREWCGWYCAGYEVNVPNVGRQPWPGVPSIGRHQNSGKIDLNIHWCTSAYKGCSVPSST